jgi:hypothetical protein
MFTINPSSASSGIAIWPSPAVTPSTALREESMIGRARFGTLQLTGPRPSESAVAVQWRSAQRSMRSRTGRSTCWGQRTQRGALPADRAPGDQQPDDADHEEQRDEVMQPLPSQCRRCAFPGACAHPPVP